MTNTLNNIEIQEIESINVVPMDTPISFEEVMPGDASDDAEELNIQPCLGLEFESLEKVREFIIHLLRRMVLEYVFDQVNQIWQSWYVIVKVNTNKRKCSTLRTNCQASLTVSRGDITSNWVIKSFSNDHNHVMLSPRSVCYMRCHKKMSSLVEKFEEEGLPIGKVASIFNNGDSSFSNRDCWNHIRNL
ncbi:Protein FAR1-RELATED SEQUENCE 5 [Glycine max]|nr:Protein FAR1-RELATED SEQUENCE 5 [Glycine max]